MIAEDKSDDSLLLRNERSTATIRRSNRFLFLQLSRENLMTVFGDTCRNTSQTNYVWQPLCFLELCTEYPRGMVLIDHRDKCAWKSIGSINRKVAQCNDIDPGRRDVRALPEHQTPEAELFGTFCFCVCQFVFLLAFAEGAVCPFDCYDCRTAFSNPKHMKLPFLQ